MGDERGLGAGWPLLASGARREGEGVGGADRAAAGRLSGPSEQGGERGLGAGWPLPGLGERRWDGEGVGGADRAPAGRLQGHRDRVESVAWAPDGRWVASGSRDGTVKVWEAYTGRCVSTLFFDWVPKEVVFLPVFAFQLVVADSAVQCFGYEVVGNLGAGRS